MSDTEPVTMNWL